MKSKLAEKGRKRQLAAKAQTNVLPGKDQADTYAIAALYDSQSYDNQYFEDSKPKTAQAKIR